MRHPAPRHAGFLVKIVWIGTIVQHGPGAHVGGPCYLCSGVTHVLRHWPIGDLNGTSLALSYAPGAKSECHDNYYKGLFHRSFLPVCNPGNDESALPSLVILMLSRKPGCIAARCTMASA